MTLIVSSTHCHQRILAAKLIFHSPPPPFIFSLTATASDFDRIIDSLSSKDPGSEVVVLFTRQEDAIGLLEAAKRRDKFPKKKFHWVASDGWGSQSLLVQGTTRSSCTNFEGLAILIYVVAKLLLVSMLEMIENQVAIEWVSHVH